MDYIEGYFNKELSEEQKKEFERKITTEPAFAEEVAFYLSTKQAIAAGVMEERQRVKEIYTQYKQDSEAGGQKPAMVRKLWPWLAAAAAVLAGIIFGWNVWFKPASPKVLAD